MSTMNTTTNGTHAHESSCFDPDNLTAGTIGKIVAYCLFFVVSLAGNSFIAIIVYKTKTMRKTINFLIVNMAMSDLLFPIFVFPSILSELEVISWPSSGALGQTLCKLHVTLPDISVVVSIQCLVLITVDRFSAVLFPLRSPLISSKLCPFFIVATWVVAIITTSPHLKALTLVQYPGGLQCEWKWKEAFGESSSLGSYVLAVYVIFLYIPLASMAILYSLILFKLKSQTIPGEKSDNAGKQREKRDRHVLRMAIAIVLGFAISWVPYSIVALLTLFPGDNTSRLNSRLDCGFVPFGFITRILSRANCAISPCICFIFGGNFRQGLRSLLNRA